jgi:hypothetical protein
MFKSLRSLTASDSLNVDSTDDAVISLLVEQQSIPISHDGFSIGSGRNCDLKLNEPKIPFLHSVIHTQCGAVWIEIADETASLQVNDHPCRRMALRHGDRLTIGSINLAIDLGLPSEQLRDESFIEKKPKEDLQSLTAEELCDRIVTEQAMVQELSEGENSGWEALLHAIKAVRIEPTLNEVADDATLPLQEEIVSYDALFGQIQELHETIVDRSRDLDLKEAEVLASTSIIEQSQQRVTQRIDEILDQLNKSEGPTEFRASA